jgi:hypothetical protein
MSFSIGEISAGLIAICSVFINVGIFVNRLNGLTASMKRLHDRVDVVHAGLDHLELKTTERLARIETAFSDLRCRPLDVLPSRKPAITDGTCAP